MKLLLLCVLSICCFPVLAAAQKDQAELLKPLQGTWQIHYPQDADGNRTVLTKEVTGTRERVIVTRDNNVIHEHVVDFEARTTDNVSIFTYRNYTVLQGPNKGVVRKAPVSYIYRVTATHWFCITGAMTGDVGPLRVDVYEKVSDETPDMQEL